MEAVEPTCGWVATVGDAARFVVGFVLVVAGVAKLGAASTREQLMRAIGELLGVRRHRSMASLLVLVELGIGATLIGGLGGRIALAAAGALLVGFTVILYELVRRGYDAPCGCFGALSSRPSRALDLVRNAVLCGLLLVAARAAPGCAMNPPWRTRLEASGLAAAGFFVLAVIYTLAGQVLHFVRESGSHALRKDMPDE